MKGFLFSLFSLLIVLPLISSRSRETGLNKDYLMKFYKDSSSKIQTLTLSASHLYLISDSFDNTFVDTTVSFKSELEELYDNVHWAAKQSQALLLQLSSNIQLKLVTGQAQPVAITIDQWDPSKTNYQMKLYVINDTKLLITISNSVSSKMFEYNAEGNGVRLLIEKNWKSIKCVTIELNAYCVGIDNSSRAYYIDIAKNIEDEFVLIGISTYSSIDIMTYNFTKKTLLICFVSPSSPYQRSDCVEMAVEDATFVKKPIVDNHSTEATSVNLYFDTKIRLLLMKKNFYEMITVEEGGTSNSYSFRTNTPGETETIEDVIVIDSKLYLLFRVQVNTLRSFRIKEYIACADFKLIAIQNEKRTFTATDATHSGISFDLSSPPSSITWSDGKFLATDLGSFQLKYKYSNSQANNDELFCTIDLVVYKDKCQAPSSSGTCYQCTTGLYLLLPGKECVFPDDYALNNRYAIDDKSKEIYPCPSNCDKCIMKGYRETQCVTCAPFYLSYLLGCVESCPSNTYLYGDHSCFDECPQGSMGVVIEGKRKCIDNPNVIDPELNEKLNSFNKKSEAEKTVELKQLSAEIIDDSIVSMDTLRLMQKYGLFLSHTQSDIREESTKIIDKLFKNAFKDRKSLLDLVDSKANNLKDLLLTMSLISNNSNKLAEGDSIAMQDMTITLCQNSKALIDSMQSIEGDLSAVSSSTILGLVQINEQFLNHSYHFNQIHPNFNDTLFESSLEYRYNNSAIINKRNTRTSEVIKSTSLLFNQLLPESSFAASDLSLLSFSLKSTEPINVIKLNMRIDFNTSYTNYELIQQMQKHHYEAIILLPYEHLINDSTNTCLNIIYYKRKYPFLNPNITKDIHASFFELYFSHTVNDVFERKDTGKIPIRLIIRKPSYSFKECIYYDSKRFMFLNAKCSSIHVSEYVLCSCEVIEPFSLSTFNAGMFHSSPTDNINDDRFFNPFEVLKRFSFEKAPVAYVCFTILVFYAMGLVAALINDCCVDSDPFIIYTDKKSTWCRAGDIRDNCVYLSMEIYDYPSLVFPQKETTSPKTRSKKNSIVKNNLKRVFTKKKHKSNNEIAIEMQDKASESSSEPEHPPNKQDKPIKNALISSSNDSPRLFRDVFVYFLKQEYRLVSLFVWKLKLYSKAVTLTLFISRLIITMSICSVFSPCAHKNNQATAAYDLAVGVYAVLIAEIPFTLFELGLKKKKIERQAQMKEIKINLQRIVIGMITFLVIVSCSIYGTLNALCISIVNYEQDYQCNIIEDFFLATVFDWAVFEMALLCVKALMIWIITRNQKEGFLKCFFIALIAAFPWFIPSVA